MRAAEALLALAVSLLICAAGLWVYRTWLMEPVERWRESCRAYRGGRHANGRPAPGGASYLRRLLGTSTAAQRHRALDPAAAYIAPPRPIHIERIELRHNQPEGREA